MNLLMYRQTKIFLGIGLFWTFCPTILVGIFTMKLADGWMDRIDDGYTDGQMEFEVESHLG